MENALPATTPITGIKPQECALFARKLMSLISSKESVSVLKSCPMILVFNVSTVSGQNTGTKILKPANNVLQILITLKVSSTASRARLWPQSGTAKNVWAALLVLFLILPPKLVKAVLRDLSLNPPPWDVFAPKTLTWLLQNALAAILPISGTSKRKHVFLALNPLNMTFIKKSVFVHPSGHTSLYHLINALHVKRQDIGTN